MKEYYIISQIGGYEEDYDHPPIIQARCPSLEEAVEILTYAFEVNMPKKKYAEWIEKQLEDNSSIKVFEYRGIDIYINEIEW